MAKYSYANLFDKQRQALRLLGDNTCRYVLYGGGAGGGKSWLGCEWLAGMALVFPGTRWFIARNELKKIKQSTAKTLAKVARLKKFSYEYNDQKGLVKFANGSEIDFLELKHKPSDPMFEDLGSLEYTGGFIEEAGEISFEAFDTMRTRVGRHLNSEYGIPPKIFITCNPKKNWLYTDFYKPYREGCLPEHYAFIQSLVTDNPEIDEGYIDSLRDIRNKAKRLRLLEGLWEYDDNPYALYDFEQIADCFDSNDRHLGKTYITSDVARLGKDTTVIIVWEGWIAKEIVRLAQSRVTDTANAIKNLQRKYNVPASRTIVDEDGVGGGVVDMLRCKGFVNNARPIGDNNYQNLKAECAFRLRDFIGKLRFEQIAFRDEIMQELEAVEEIDGEKDGKLKVTPRQEMIAKIGRSPDFFSAIIERVFFELVPEKKLRTMVID